MKTRRFGVPGRVAGMVMMALLGGAALVANGVSPEPAAQDWDKVQVKAVPVAGGIHTIAGPGGNVGVLPGDGGVLDAEWTKATGMPPEGFVALVYKSLPRR